ncbi:MAG: TetR/AcrR family transcriptional regulator [Dehalococcoidia bacterium]|nr:TetR/AcrR family transcriptional regulator [Dehalococcoidia bacterium]
MSRTGSDDAPPARRRPGPQPSAELAAQRKKEIVRAAAQVFFQKGYAPTGMDDIAAALGSTKGMIYHYFKSKSEIVFSLFCDVQDEAKLRFEQLLESSETPREALHCIIEYCATRVMEDEWRCAFVMASELNQALSDTDAQIVHDKARSSTDVVRQVVEAGIAQGQFMPGHPRVLARICLNTVLQTAEWFQPGGSVTHHELAHTVTQFVLKGIARTPAREALTAGWGDAPRVLASAPASPGQEG